MNAESCQKMKGAVECQERQRRASEEITGTEAKKRDRTETKGDRRRGSNGITKGEAASARTEGSRGVKRRKPIKGANGPRPEAVETLPEANQRGKSVVSGGPI